MKYLSWILFVITLSWAGVITYKYVELKNNPLIMNVSPELRSGEGQSLDQMERVSFVRQFVERYVSFDFNNFWQGQTALSFLMTPDLREKRLAEISRVKEKIRKNAIVQRGRILSVQRGEDQIYRILSGVELSESRNVNHLNVSIEMTLTEGARSLENPWGLVVSKFKTDLQSQPAAFSGQFSMTKDSPTILWDPLESTCRHASLSIL